MKRILTILVALSGILSMHGSKPIRSEGTGRGSWSRELALSAAAEVQPDGSTSLVLSLRNTTTDPLELEYLPWDARGCTGQNFLLVNAANGELLTTTTRIASSAIHYAGPPTLGPGETCTGRLALADLPRGSYAMTGFLRTAIIQPMRDANGERSYEGNLVTSVRVLPLEPFAFDVR